MNPPAGTTAGPSPAQRRRERERSQARREILAAARALGAEEGWDAVTMRRLADRIEYSPNFAYRYFSGRNDILLAVARDGFSQLRTAVADAVREAPADQAPYLAARAYLNFALAELDLYQLMYGLGGNKVPTTDTWREGQAVGDLFVDVFGAAGVADASDVVLRLWATAHGLIALLAVGRVDPDPAHLIRMLDASVAAALAG